MAEKWPARTGTPKPLDLTVAHSSLHEVRRLCTDVLAGQHADIYLFGSWARGDAGPSSDIDIAVDVKGLLDPAILAELRWRLEESNIPYRVDVVDLRHVSHDFRARVLDEGILWFGHSMPGK